jgi:hypothetical protein
MSSPPLEWSGGTLDGTPWQGIRYLSIEFPSGGPARAVVTVHLNQRADDPAQPANFVTPEDVFVNGGRRVTQLDPDVAVTGANVVLSFTQFGDHSPYRVQLAAIGNSALTVHPFFASSEFRFTINCEAGDCRTGSEQALAVAKPRPAIDLLTKDYDGFLKLLADWVKVHNPHWADLSPASFERVLVELLAWQGDMLSYYQDRVANEAFVDTASQRYSLRQHAVLLGTRIFDGSVARTVLAFDVAGSGYVPAGLEVRTAPTAHESPVVFSVRERSEVQVENNSAALTVAAFPGAASARVPSGANELLLWGQANRLRSGQRLAFVQGDFSQVVTLSEVQHVSEPGWVESPAHSFDPVLDAAAPLTRIRWIERLNQPLSPWSAQPKLAIHGNLVDAEHGSGRTARVESVEGPLTQPGLHIRLNRRNSIVGHLQRGTSDVYQLRALQVPDGPVVHEAEGAGSRPALEVLVDGERWERREHLHASRSYDAHYTAEADTDGSLWIRFGDSVHGRAIAVARDLPRKLDRTVPEVQLRYRVGDPISGNVGLSTLREIVRPASGSDKETALSSLGRTVVTNVRPGTGGHQPQSLDQVRDAIPTAVRHGALERAVSLEDYARVAMQDSEVARAAARALGGVFNSVLVLIDPRGSEEPSTQLLARVHARLDTLRMAGREIFVAGAKYVALELALLLCIEDGFAAHEVRERVLTELRPGSALRPGWFHPDRLSFGDDVRLGDLIGFVQRVPGVRAVKATKFRRLGERSDTVQQSIVMSATEVGRLDADPDFPEHGTLEVRIASGPEQLAARTPASFSVDVAQSAGGAS